MEDDPFSYVPDGYIEKPVTLAQTEYNKLQKQSEKYLAYVKCHAYIGTLDSYSEVGNIPELSDVDCAEEGCPAAVVQLVGVREHKYYINCKGLRACNRCHKSFCHRHAWYYVEKICDLPRDGKISTLHEKYQCCRKCLGWFTDNKFDISIDDGNGGRQPITVKGIVE
jgi:hypothetical protein